MWRYLTVKRLSVFILSCYIVVFLLQVSFYSEWVNRSRDAPVTSGIDVSNDAVTPDFTYGVADSTFGFSAPFEGLLVYSAYLDQRELKPNIRIVALVDKWNPLIGWCHFWPADSAKLNSAYRSKQMEKFAFFDEKSNSNLSVPMVFYETCEGHGSRYVAFIITCAVPVEVNDKVKTVVLSKSQAWVRYEPVEFINQSRFEIPVIPVRNNNPNEVRRDSDGLKTFPNHVKRRKFAVCIPPLFGTIPTDYMIEFLELTRILGADHFFFYSYALHKHLAKLLDMYAESGIVTVLPWTHALAEEDIWYYGQSAAIADCLYRAMGHFDWIAFNDIDEFMVPRDNYTKSGTWEEFLTVYEKLDGTNFNNIVTLAFQSAVFDISRSRYTHIVDENFLTMETVKRTASISRILTKQFVRPERVFELGIHHLSKQFREHYYSQLVKPEVGLLHHYRKCGHDFACDANVPDKTIQRYDKALRERTKLVFNKFRPKS